MHNHTLPTFPVWDQAAESPSGPAGPGPRGGAWSSHADPPCVGQTGQEFSSCRRLNSWGVWWRGRPEKPQGAPCYCRYGVVSKALFSQTELWDISNGLLNCFGETAYIMSLSCILMLNELKCKAIVVKYTYSCTMKSIQTKNMSSMPSSTNFGSKISPKFQNYLQQSG